MSVQVESGLSEISASFALDGPDLAKTHTPITPHTLPTVETAQRSLMTTLSAISAPCVAAVMLLRKTVDLQLRDSQGDPSACQILTRTGGSKPKNRLVNQPPTD